MIALLIALAPLWFGQSPSSSPEEQAGSPACTLEVWLTRHPADSVLHLVAADSLDHTVLPLGSYGPTVPPAEVLTGIGAEVTVGVILDTLGNVASAEVCNEHITRYQGGIAPDEVRRLAPKFDAAALVVIKGSHFSVPQRDRHKVTAFASMMVRYDPTRAGKDFRVWVHIVP